MSTSRMNGGRRSTSTSIVRYGRERAGLAATVITYRSKSAIRDVGKALGLSSDTIDRLARTAPGWDQDLTAARLRDAGIDPRDRTARRTLALAGQLYGFPRHLSQHVGGFVITRGAWTRACRSRMRRWRTGPASNGTRTISTRLAC